MQRLIAWTMLLLVLAACGGATVTPAPAGSSDVPIAVASAVEATTKTVKIGETIPDFAWTIDGKTQHFSDFRGKLVIINFWETTCIPCRTEMPDFETLSQERDDVVVLSINRREREELITQFAQQYGVTFTILPDREGVLTKAFGVLQVIPMSFFVDATGVLQRTQIGVMTRSQMDRFLSDMPQS